MARMVCSPSTVMAPQLFSVNFSAASSTAAPQGVGGRGYGQPTGLRIVVLRSSFCQVEMGHDFVADLWSGRTARRKSRKVAGPIRSMAEDTMWITASSAVALVVALAAFAALGGYLLSKGADNAERGEEEKIEKLKKQGIYKKPEPTQYEQEGVATRTRKRRITEE